MQEQALKVVEQFVKVGTFYSALVLLVAVCRFVKPKQHITRPANAPMWHDSGLCIIMAGVCFLACFGLFHHFIHGGLQVKTLHNVTAGTWPETLEKQQSCCCKTAWRAMMQHFHELKCSQTIGNMRIANRTARKIPFWEFECCHWMLGAEIETSTLISACKHKIVGRNERLNRNIVNNVLSGIEDDSDKCRLLAEGLVWLEEKRHQELQIAALSYQHSYQACFLMALLVFAVLHDFSSCTTRVTATLIVTGLMPVVWFCNSPLETMWWPLLVFVILLWYLIKQM